MNTKPDPKANDEDVCYSNNNRSGDEPAWKGRFEDKADFDSGLHLTLTDENVCSLVVCDPSSRSAPKTVNQSELAKLLASNELAATYRSFEKIVFEFSDLNAVKSESTKRGDLDKDEIFEAFQLIFNRTSLEGAKSILALADYATRSELPDRAPELYKDRADKAESAPDFVRKVYGEFLDGRLTFKDLGMLDPPLKQALYNWEKNGNGPLPQDLNLKSMPVLNEETISKMSPAIQDEVAKLGGVIAKRRSAKKNDL